MRRTAGGMGSLRERLIKTEDGKEVLDGSADPSDFGVIIWPDGWCVSGGAIPDVESFYVPDEIADQIKAIADESRKALE